MSDDDSFVDDDSDVSMFSGDDEPKAKGKAVKKAAPKKETTAKKAAPKKETAKKSAASPKKTKAKAASKATGEKKPRAKKAKADDSDAEENDSSSPVKSLEERTLEEIYQKKTPLEHILLRPDTYIGSVEKQDCDLWVWEDDQMVFRTINYVPGLYKIFDEILVNAADNRQRDKKMTTIRVEIDPAKNTISVLNNGAGIPVEIHAEEKIYIPSMIFGELLTSSNYDDGVRKVTGGRNGYGAKLCNIFSTEFVVETSSSKSKKKFKQVFNKNMSIKHEPEISKATEEDYTKITYTPDLSKFGMVCLDDDIVALMSKRVYDVAGCNPKLKVFLNGTRIKVDSFEDYMKLYVKEDAPCLYEKVNDRWEVGISVTDGSFQQVSFVNSICTTRGGTHVNHAVEKIVKTVIAAVEKKNKGGATIKPGHVKNYLWVFVNSLIENPAFDSQTKETLNSKASSFGSVCALSDSFINKVTKCGVVERLISWNNFQAMQQLSKKSGKKTSGRLAGIAKLEDANKAGSKAGAKDCTLILTEGDSAKTLAISGMSVVGRDYYGVFPLRGKLLNVRDATFQSVVKNAEIDALVKILGLTHGAEYKSVDSLRYGHLMIMTDQDHDGSHIKGLLVNFIHYFWPSLLKLNGFMTEFITPIVKAKAKKGKEELSFYTIPEYKEWKQSVNVKNWDIKYYKGLGTSTPAEGREYFSAIEDHQLDFEYEEKSDGQLIDMAFNKNRADDRKDWLGNFKPGTFLDQSVGVVPVSDFINKELILFSMADNERSIPCIMDGFKTSQRKVLYCCFKRNLKKEIKVAQLAGYVSEHSAYHHGEMSLQSTIIHLAHDFVGSNNINTLYPAGSFGSRLQGGDDAASARYIHTRLEDLTRFLFHPDDDPLLTYLNDDGKKVEPKWYAPIIPMALINGSSGIGTGWSSTIPPFNPKDVVQNVRNLIKGAPLIDMHPWFSGFKGTIEKDPKSGYSVAGIWRRIDETTLEVTELPTGMWTDTYKEFLELGCVEDKKKQPFVKSFDTQNSDTIVSFRINTIDPLPTSNAELEKKFKLRTKVNLTNMVLFDAEGRIRKYESAEQILNEFYALRLTYYEKRKDFLVDKLKEEWKRVDNKVRFILMVVNKELVISNRKRKDLMEELRRLKFDPLPPKMKLKAKKKGAEEDEIVDEDEGEDEEEEAEEQAKEVVETDNDFDYLLSMPLWNLTLEKVRELTASRDEKAKQLQLLLTVPPTDMWLKDLDTFEENYEKWLEKKAAKASASSAIKKGKGKRKLVKPKKKKKANSDSEAEFVDKKATKARNGIEKNAHNPFAANAKSKKRKTPEPKGKKAAATASSSSSPVKEESKQEEEMSLTERLAMNGKKSPFKDQSSKRRKTTKKEDSDGEGDDFEADDTPVKKEPTKRAPAKRAPKKSAGSDEEDEKPKKAPAKRAKKASDDEDEEPKKAPAPKKASEDKDEKPKAKAAPKRLRKMASDSEDEASDSFEEPKKDAAPRAVRAVRAKATTNYASMMGSDDDDISDVSD